MRKLQSCKLVVASAFAAMLLGAVTQACADDVPVLNVDPVCHGIAQQAAAPSERGGPDLAFTQCVESERAARDKLAAEWTTFGAADKTSCLAEARMAGLPSYTDLLTCLEMARDVRQLKSPGAPPRSVKQ